jgi:hypothetical protein
MISSPTREMANATLRYGAAQSAVMEGGLVKTMSHAIVSRLKLSQNIAKILAQRYNEVSAGPGDAPCCY